LQQLHKPKAATIVPQKSIKPIKPIQPIKPQQIAVKKAATVDGLKM
jgi:hypothetical protein